MKITGMVEGYPIEEISCRIYSRRIILGSGLLIAGIMKKESNWKRVPVLEGQDCFNYWGYRGVQTADGNHGHTCFNSRKEVVDTKRKRIEKLV